MSVSCESFYFLSLIEERYTRFHFELIMIPKQSQHDAGYVVSTSLFADVIFDGSEKAVRRAVEFTLYVVLCCGLRVMLGCRAAVQPLTAEKASDFWTLDLALN